MANLPKINENRKVYFRPIQNGFLVDVLDNFNHTKTYTFKSYNSATKFIKDYFKGEKNEQR